MKKLIFFVVFVLFFSSHSISSPLYDTWSGPGPNACGSVCTLEWARSQLTKEERKELDAAIADSPEPYLIKISNGSIFTFTSYQIEGKPISYRNNTLAVLDTPEKSYGWIVNGWSFVKIESCGNWTKVIMPPVIGKIIDITPPLPNPMIYSRNITQHIPPYYNGIVAYGGGSNIVINHNNTPIDTYVPDVIEDNAEPIPTPSGFGLMLFGFLTFFFLKTKKPL